MNGDDVIRMMEDYHTYSSTVVCRNCGKPYYQDREEQVPGFRDMEYDNCPYCQETNGKSMSFDYHNYPMTDDQIAEYTKLHKGE